MALIVGTSSTGSGVRYDLGTTDSIFVSSFSQVTSTDTIAILATGNAQTFTIEGHVFGASDGIRIGDSATDDSGIVRVLAGATVVGGDDAIEALGSGTRIQNEGSLSGNYGIFFGGAEAIGTSIYNAGSITARSTALLHRSSGVEDVTVVNLGRIVSTVSGVAYSSTNASAVDEITNRGFILGDLRLGGGADRVDNRGGTIEGTIDGGAGEDVFLPGAEAEVFDGGTDADTIDFRGGTVVRVALDGSFANSGAARGDGYISIENIQGTAFGDALTGNVSANRLRGWGGADTLNGGGGGDQIIGGTGIDRLTGAAGNDKFVFESLGQCGDTITDFTNAGGNNDSFRIDASAFGGGLVAGALAASQFVTRTDNLAQDANDRFIFRTSDRTLWFDSNGSSGGGLTLVADLQSTATMTAGDIFLI